MNPFSLLSKGETVKGLKNRDACYKMVPGNALPNFSGPKRPYPATAQPASEEKPADPPQQGDAAATVDAAPAEEKPAEPAQTAAQTECAPYRRVAAAAEEKPPKLEDAKDGKDTGVAASTEEKLSNAEQRRDGAAAVAAALMEKTPSKPGIWSGLWRGTGGWIGKRLFRGKAGSGSPSVQTELALEKVTVIRNDLYEDDVEVVENERTKRVRAVQNKKPETLAPNA